MNGQPEGAAVESKLGIRVGSSFVGKFFGGRGEMTEKIGGHLSRSYIILEEAQVIQVDRKGVIVGKGILFSEK